MVPGPPLVFVGDAAAWIAFQPPLSGDQAPSSDAFEPLTPGNATDFIIIEPAEAGNISCGSVATNLLSFPFQDSLLFHVHGLQLLVLKLSFAALWSEQQVSEAETAMLLLELKRAELPTLMYRRLQDICILMYKVKHKLCPTYINFVKFLMIIILPTFLRQSDSSIPSYNTVAYGKHSLRYLGPRLWGCKGCFLCSS